MFSTTTRLGFGIFVLAVLSFQSTDSLAKSERNLAWLPSITDLLLSEEQSNEEQICTQSGSGVYIVNLGVDIVDNKPSCLINISPYNCVVNRIKQALPKSCRKEIDIFIPGTNQEDGDWKQFNALVSKNDNRGALSLNYVTAGDFGQDGLRYDDGVKSVFDRLPILLNAIRNEFKPNNVRIYGHSKGSHPVALLADEYAGDDNFANFKFYAFGQAKRTAVDIDNRSDIKAGRLGDKGYIQKLSDNLVGITWSNDEVHFYEGSGFNGLKVPPRWLHAGRVNDTSTGGLSLQTKLRIDHHDTYGGTFTKEDSFPYCATGRYKSLSGDFPRFLNQCDKRDEDFIPYFWNNDDCRNLAWDMLESEEDSVPDKVWIGSSGPRAASGCQEDLSLYNATYKLAYRYNRADQQCKYNLKIAFNGLNGRPGGGEIKASASNGNTFQVKTQSGSVTIPPHMRLVVTASLSEQNTDGPGPIVFKCDKFAQTESYIDYLEVTFTNPTNAESRTMSLIGNNEGSNYPAGRVTDKDLSGWKKGSGEWRMEYDTILDTLKIEGETKKGANGNFTKIIHLID